MDIDRESEARRSGGPLPVAVVLLGLTSFFTDLGSDMIFPLLPVFLVGQLGASAAFVGLVEGIADTIASLLKLVAGYLAENVVRPKSLVVFGYGLAAVVRPLVALATAPWHVLAVRSTDRIGKGIRTAPRDVILANAAGERAGRAFGFHRAMDHAGAVAGPLAATALIAAGFAVRTVFWIAAIPGVLSVLTVLFVREPSREPVGIALETRPPAALPRPPNARSFARFLAILALFSIANSSDAFLLLRARELGVSVGAIPLLWAALHVSKLVSSYVGGEASDRFGRKRLIVAGWIVYAATYFGLGIADEPWQAWVLFLVYGTYYGLTEPVEKALVKDLTPRKGRGRAFGFYNFITGITALPASLLTGWIWQSFGAKAALELGAAVALLASALLAVWSRGKAETRAIYQL